MAVRHAAAILPDLRGLKIAHLVAADQVFNASLLIGADYY